MPINYRTDAGVAFITLDEPAKRNALSPEMIGEVSDHLAAAVADPHVRSVIIDHAGSTFCSGADLSEASTEGMEVGARRIVDLQRLIVSMGKPVVTRIDGPVRAGGIGIVAVASTVLSRPSVGACFPIRATSSAQPSSASRSQILRRKLVNDTTRIGISDELTLQSVPP